MASGAGIIKNEFLKLAASLDQTVKRIFARLLGETGERLRVSLDGESRSLLAGFAEQGQMTVEEAAVCWLGLQAYAYRQNKEVEQLWTTLTDREQQIVALCCLEYSDHEIAAMLDIAYGTARTHLYNAIRKLGITKKSELHFLLRNWDFSKFDHDF